MVSKQEKDYLHISPKWAAIIVSAVLSIAGAFIAGGVSFVYIQFQVNANTAEIEYRRKAVYGIEQMRLRINTLEKGQESLIERVDGIQNEQLRRSREVWGSK